MAASDTFGILGSLALAIPAVRDQYYRFRQAAQARKRKASPWPGLRTAVMAAWQVRRDAFHPVDSLLALLGALGLAAAFMLKSMDL